MRVKYRRGDSRNFQEEQDKSYLSEFTSGFSSGVDTTLGSLGGVRSLFNSITGDEEEAIEYLNYAQRKFQEAGESSGTVTNIEDIDGASDFVRWATYSAGTILPSIATSIAGGGIGGAVAQGVAKKFTKDRIQREVKDAVEDKVSERVKKRILRETLDADTAGYRTLGQAVGTFGASAAQNTGGTFVDIYEETGIEAPDVALAAGVAAGALDSVLPFVALKRIMPDTVFNKFKDGVADKLVKNGGVTRRVLLQGGLSAGAEGITEAGQELIQATAVGMMRNDPMGGYAEYFDEFIKNVNNPDDQLVSRLLNAAAVGAIGGAATGSFTGALNRKENRVDDVRVDREPTTDTVEEDAPDGAETVPDANEVDPETQSILEAARQDQRDARRKAQGFPQSMPDITDRDVDAETDARVGEAQARQRAAARRAQGLPEQAVDRETTSPEEARNARYETDLNESLRRSLRARKVVNEIIPASIFETGDATPEENALAAKEAEKLTVIPSGPTIELGPDRTMESLERSSVDYQGIEGTLTRREDGVYVVVTPQGDQVVVESGESDAGSTAATLLGVRPKDVEVNTPDSEAQYNADDDTFVARGKTYRYIDTQRNKDGEAVAINAETMNGQPRVFRSKRTVQAVEAERARIQQESMTQDLATGQAQFDDLSDKLQMAVFDEREAQGLDTTIDEVTIEEVQAAIASSPAGIQSALQQETEALFSRTDQTEFDVRQTFDAADQWLSFEGDVVNANQETLESRQDRIDVLAGQPTKPANSDDLITIRAIEGIAEKIADAMRRPTFFNETVDGKQQNVEAKPMDSLGDADTINEIQQSIFDLIEAGLPVDFVSQIQALATHSPAQSQGLGATVSDRMSIESSLVSQSTTDANADRELRYVLAHEAWHVLDNANDISGQLPSFNAEVVFSGEGPKVVLGDAIADLYENYLQKTELGRRFTYPFNEIEQQAGPATNAEDLAEFIRKESFAQLGAVYLSNPKLLKEQAPEAYNVIRTIRDNPTLATGENDARVQDTNVGVQPEGTGVQGEVRPSTVSGSAEVEADGGSGEAGLDGAQAGQANQGVGGETQQEAGDGDGSTLLQERVDETPEQGSLFARRLNKKPSKQEQSRRDFIKKMATVAVVSGSGVKGTSYYTEIASNPDLVRGKAKPISSFVQRSLPEESVSAFAFGDLPKAIDIAVEGAPQDVIALAEKIKATLPSQDLYDTDVQRGLWNVAGMVSMEDKPTISIMPDTKDSGMTATLLHEAMHLGIAARYRSLSTAVSSRNYELLGMDQPKAREALDQWYSLWGEFRRAANPNLQNSNVKNLPPETRIAYGKPDEFFVRALTQPEFQQQLHDLNYEGKTLLSKFKDWVKKYLFGPDTGVQPTYLDAALTAANDLLDASMLDSPDFTFMKNVNINLAEERGGTQDESANPPTLFVRRLLKGLSDQESQAEASTLLSGEESLQVEVTGKNNRRTVTDVSRALDTRTLQIFGRSLADRTDENAEIVSNIMAAEAEYALSRDGNAGEWYQQKVANAMMIAEEIFPDLKDSPNQQAMFKAALAITSNGSSVDENSANTINKVFGSYIETGKFPIVGFGKESPSMKRSFKLLNVMIEEMGLDGVREFLSTDFTVRELKEAGFKVNGEGVDTVVRGSAILGPKIGQGFYQNLQGNYDTLTMDLWYMRTWGRISGNLMSDSDRKLPESLSKFREEVLANEKARLRKEGIKVSDFRKDDEVATDLAIKMNSEFARGNYKNKTPANNAARNLKNATKAQETPRGSGEREYMRKVTRMAVDKLNAATGENINTAAFQALIWYPEKDLYNKLGTPNKKSEPTDYETEFAKIAKERGVSEQAISRIIGLEQQSGAGGVQQDSRSDAGIEDAPSGTEPQQADEEQGLAATVKVGKPNTKVRPSVKRAYAALKSGQITRQEYDEVVLETIRPYEAVPTPATNEEMVEALAGRQKDRVNAPIEGGEPVGLRLDINAYEKFGTWVPTIHDAKGKPKSHMATAAITEADFRKFNQEKSQKVMEGVNKSPFAQIKGAYVGRSTEENVRLAQQYLNDPEWRQVGFDPRRHATFYDRVTGESIATADEVIQVGPLVLAKNAVIQPAEQTLFVKRLSGQNKTHQDASDDGTLMDGKPSTSEFNLDDETRTEAVIRKLQDKYLPLKKFEKKATEFLGLKELPERFRTYVGETLHSGKVKDDNDRLEQNYIKPIGTILRENSIDVDDFGIYLIAKHAPERNSYIASINPAIQEAGSGMSNADAERVIATFESDGTAKAMNEAADLTYKMLAENRKRLTESGLVDDDTVDGWNQQYKFYVPLKGFAASLDEDSNLVAPKGLPRGFSISGKEVLAALGRTTQSDNPLLYAMNDVENKIVRARRNEVAQRFLGLARELSGKGSKQLTVYEDPASFPMDRERSGSQVREKRMDAFDMRDAVRKEDNKPRFLSVKEDGKEIFIEIKDQALNNAMHNVSAENFDSLVTFLGQNMNFLQKFQIWRRNTLINYNPSWFLINPLRDIQTGIMYTMSESSKSGGMIEGEAITGDILAGYFPAARAYFKNLRGGRVDSELDEYFDEYQASGAPTGLTLTREIDEQKKRLENIITEGNLVSNIRKVGDLVQDLNTASENTVRFAAYVASRRNGVEVEKAANLAKNMTVNFNRKGEMSAGLNAFYLFFNAAVQGTANIAQAMTGRTESGGLNKAQMAAVGIGLTAYMITEHNILGAEEDDDGESLYKDLTGYDKLMSWNIVRPDGESFFQIPMPYGYGMFHTMGRLSAELAHGLIDENDFAAEITAASVHHFLPPPLGFVGAVGTEDDLMDFTSRAVIDLVPDIIEPFASLSANMNHFGSPIYLEQNSLMDSAPDSSKSKRSTEKVYKETAQFLNEVFGGSEFRKGGVDLSPDAIKYATEFATGGLGRFISRSSDVGILMANEIEKDDPSLGEFPILRYFVGEPSQFSDKVEYYEGIRDLQEVFNEAEASTGDDRRQFLEKFGGKVRLEPLYKQTQKQLRALRQKKKSIEKMQSDPARAYDQIQRIEAQMDLLFDRFNKKYREANQ